MNKSKGPSKGPSNKLFFMVLAFIVGAGLVTLVGSRRDSNSATTGNAAGSATGSDTTAAIPVIETAPITITGGALPPFPEDPTAADPARAQNAPILTGVNFANEPVTVGPKPGRRLMVVAVAHWCPHCQREVPRLVEWQASGAVPEDLDVVLLVTRTTADAPNYPPSAWLLKEGNPFPVIVDDEAGSGVTAFGGMGFPNLQLVGTDGKMIARASGEQELEQLSAFAALT